MSSVINLSRIFSGVIASASLAEMTPDFVSEYATLNGMVKACQRFIMALADVIFDATTRLPSRCSILVCSCLYHISGSKRPIPLYPWETTALF